MNIDKKNKKLVLHKGGYLPKDKLIANEKIHKLLDNPPDFDPTNKREILNWIKTIYSLYKS